MRWKILQSTLIVVAITGLVLGGPLAFAWWRLVEHFARTDLQTRLEQVVIRLDQSSLTRTPADLHAVELVLPPDGQLVVDSPWTGRLVLGTDPGPGALVESLPLGQRGTARLAVPADAMWGDQLQAAALIGLLMALSVAIGAAVATVTARRLAGPLRDVADRAARLGAGDFRSAPTRHGIPELDRVSE
ncbi:MAG: ATP-binding protein, partial [Pseudonocardiaceae bacterium]